ncbi:MAG: dTMP kinase [Clostridiales bacterium]|nr:dTMP kinase [Clostridiales bacterium]
MKGIFITAEGTDGAGKSTQIKLLTEYLSQKGYSVVLTREPGGTQIGEKIRDLILDSSNTAMTNETEALLYAAARAQHVAEKIIPALKDGKVVICDRFIDSSFVYQGFARKLGVNFIQQINETALNRLQPELTLYFDLSPEVGIGRKKNMQELDRMERESAMFHQRVYDGYQKLAEEYPERIKKIDADRSIGEVHQAVVAEIDQLLAKRRKDV